MAFKQTCRNRFPASKRIYYRPTQQRMGGMLLNLGVRLKGRKSRKTDGETFMKSIVLAFVLLAAASNAIAQSVQVFGVGIEMHENCDITINHKEGKLERLETPFSELGQCRFLPNSETDIPRIEFIQGEYVLLLESRRITTETCRAKLAAITINRDGLLRLSKPTQSSSACGSAERKDFEILRSISHM
jgi:hypothetical protein